MNSDQTKAFERRLLEKRQNLLRNHTRTSGPAADMSPEYGRDEGDRANASQAKEMAWLQTSQERGLLQLVDAALSRVRDGTFGECAHCGQEIGSKRLAAIPWTQYCITCQELLEQYGT